jgi:hypothetical protein
VRGGERSGVLEVCGSDQPEPVTHDVQGEQSASHEAAQDRVSQQPSHEDVQKHICERSAQPRLCGPLYSIKLADDEVKKNNR